MATDTEIQAKMAMAIPAAAMLAFAEEVGIPLTIEEIYANPELLKQIALISNHMRASLGKYAGVQIELIA